MNRSKDDILVSVIVPTYKRQDYLAITLDSIMAQTHRNLELLVVADGHDVTTQEVVESRKDPRARYLFVEHAGFPAAPRNEGLRQSQGQLLAFCDDDDTWHPTKLERQIPFLLDGQYGLCTTDYDFIGSDGELLEIGKYYDDYFGRFGWETFFHSMGFICNAAGVFTREAYDQIGLLNEDPKLRAHEDFEYWMRILQRFDGYFLNQSLVGYRVHQGSIQKVNPWKVYKRRIYLHQVLKRDLNISNFGYGKKLTKLTAHFLLDQFPYAKKTLRFLQGRQKAQ